jgi:Flp pilus assembly protein TadB
VISLYLTIFVICCFCVLIFQDAKAVKTSNEYKAIKSSAENFRSNRVKEPEEDPVRKRLQQLKEAKHKQQENQVITNGIFIFAFYSYFWLFVFLN